jgi:hypothetical protein
MRAKIPQRNDFKHPTRRHFSRLQSKKKDNDSMMTMSSLFSSQQRKKKEKEERSRKRELTFKLPLQLLLLCAPTATTLKL